MFILKKIISRFLFPLALIIELLLLALIWPKKRKKFLILGIGLLYLFSFSPFSFILLWSLESRHPPLTESSIRKDIKWVVVLGGGARQSKVLTPEDRLNDASLKRLLEGLRISRHLPNAQIVLSGGDYQGFITVAQIMKDVALSLGLSPSRIVLEESSWDTRDEALFLKKQLGTEPFYLVTSASHMPRSMAIFQKVGTRPIAAPTDFQATWGGIDLLTFFPQAGALYDTERAFYEYLGLLWGWLKGYL
jgi:uncharacterized SAM-binding protein YcdF (DUF218 family)